MNFFFTMHSHFRWLVVLSLIIVLVKYIYGWMGKTKFSKLDEVLFKIYSGVIDLQITLGLIYFVWSGFAGAGFPRFRLEHGFIMIVTAVIPHLFRRWKNAKDLVRFRNGFYLILISGILIFLGVLMLPGGMARWMAGS